MEYTWIKTHEEIVEKLKGYREKQGELIQILKDAGVEVGLKDQSVPEEYDMDLTEIDPFTFFCFIYKFGEKKRLEILKNVASHWGLSKPSDTNGLPSANAQRVWMFPFKYARENKEIEKLWDFFEAGLENRITDQMFQEIIDIRNVGKTKVTEGLFYIAPHQYLPINKPTFPYFKKRKINIEFKTFSEYKSILNEVKSRIPDKRFFEISYESWVETKAKLAPTDRKYWIFQANPDYYDIEEALRNKAVKTWKVNQQKNEIKKGDKVILWVTGKNPGVIAFADIVSNVSKISEEDEELQYYRNPSESADKEELRVKINTILSLEDQLLRKQEIEELLGKEFLERMNVGKQGTNFPSTAEEYSSLLEQAESLFNENSEVNLAAKQSLNTIFFGPPGTGKTYLSIERAVQLANPNFRVPDKEDFQSRRRVYKKEYDRLALDKKIIFTTFHQSMSYEDFIEGIKPVLRSDEEESDDKLEYEMKDGILKELSVNAVCSLAKHFKPDMTGSILNFSEKYDSYIVKLQEKLEVSGELGLEIPSKSGGKIYIESISNNNNINVKHENGTRSYITSKERLSKLNKAFPDVSNIGNIHEEFRKVIGGSNSSAYWAVLNAIQNEPDSTVMNPNNTESEISDYKSQQVIFKEYIDNISKSNESASKIHKENYVLIIDEINRGNVSQIFGELITLIEEDKRIGNREYIPVTLPYSRDRFGIPNNLYIIGTMNTADRSVEALDSALRRRFYFEEISPNPQLIKDTKSDLEVFKSQGIDPAKLIETINDRIEYLLDKDHLIGHSYFMGINNMEDLKKVFANQILPLLQEYFFGDTTKIGFVIGEDFFEKPIKGKTGKHFAKFYGNNPIERDVYRLKNIRDMSLEQFIEAVRGITDDNNQ